MVQVLVNIVHAITCLLLIVAVLLQAGRGGGMGAALGGASAQIFGGRGASTFLAKLTTGLAVVFFLTSITLATMSSRNQSAVEKALEDAAKTKTTEATAPAADTAAPAADAPAPAAAPTGDTNAAPAAAPAPTAAPAPAAQ